MHFVLQLVKKISEKIYINVSVIIANYSGEWQWKFRNSDFGWCEWNQFSPLPLLIINGEISFGDVEQYGLKIGFRFK